MKRPINTTETSLSYKDLAFNKIDEEIKSFKGDQKGKIVYTYVGNVIKKFCEQNENFAETVYKTKRSLSDCVKEILNGCDRTGISDIEAYRRATKFYFPNSEVEGHLIIHITGDAPDDDYIQQEAKEPATTTTQKSNNKKKEKATENKKKKDIKKPENTIQLSLF